MVVEDNLPALQCFNRARFSDSFLIRMLDAYAVKKICTWLCHCPQSSSLEGHIQNLRCRNRVSQIWRCIQVELCVRETKEMGSEKPLCKTESGSVHLKQTCCQLMEYATRELEISPRLEYAKLLIWVRLKTMSLGNVVESVISKEIALFR